MSEAAPESAGEKRTKALNKAYSTASKRLRDQFRSVFEDFYEQEAAALGVDYKRRPTAQEKAAADLAALIEAHPELVEQFAIGDTSPNEDAPTPGT